MTDTSNTTMAFRANPRSVAQANSSEPLISFIERAAKDSTFNVEKFSA